MRVAKIALPVALVAVAASAGIALFAASRDNDDETLSAPERVRLARFERNVRVTLLLDDRLTGPTYGQLLASSDAAIVLARSRAANRAAGAGQCRVQARAVRARPGDEARPGRRGLTVSPPDMVLS
jgi:hypothetical protein